MVEAKKNCNGEKMKYMGSKNKIVIGIDQSYKDSGITITYNSEVKLVTDCYTERLKRNTEKRKALKEYLKKVFDKVKAKQIKEEAEVIVIIERIRLQSQGFLNINYIKSIGALNALIVDLAEEYDYPVFSVDTRAWKAGIIGSSKGLDNKYGIDEKKFPTIIWCIKNGYKEQIIDYDTGRKKKGIIEKNGKKYIYNDNKADSICISLYGFLPEKKQKLELEH